MNHIRVFDWVCVCVCVWARAYTHKYVLCN